jgi:cellulose synthase/poly-beta-1,6-N-acetylglucosamine synthase-like glycosyltransferase
MLQLISDGITYLTAQSGESLFHLFWFVAIFELPRYTLGFLSVAAISLRSRPNPAERRDLHQVTALIAGHNEEDSIERCVRSLHEQSRAPNEIIVVSDGSTDRMAEKMRSLQSQGLIKEAHCTQVRAGKAAALNLALSRATGDIVVVVDCDCTFDRHALKIAIEPFAEPRTGAVGANVLVRNATHSLLTAFQAIEYMISISQGKQAADLTEQMSLVSGAFGAFRRKALVSVGGFDAGGGEDLDVTLSLRKAGWKSVFAPDAICYTDVPETLAPLIRQRFRWERDAVRLRYRKHRDLLNPFSARFSWRELFHEFDFLVFNVGAALIFPIYVLWLFASFGDIAMPILLGVQAAALLLDSFTFLLAALVTPKANALRLAPYVPGYSPYNGLVMRFVRLAAYLQEWAFEASYRDTFVPAKVHRVRR